MKNKESKGEIINIGSSVGTSAIEITNILKRLYNSTSEINITGDFRWGDIAYNAADISKVTGFLENVGMFVRR